MVLPPVQVFRRNEAVTLRRDDSMQSLIDELGIESRHPDIPDAEDPIEEVSALPTSPEVDRIYNLDRDAGGFKERCLWESE